MGIPHDIVIFFLIASIGHFDVSIDYYKQDSQLLANYKDDITGVRPHTGWDINDTVEAVFVVPLSTVITGYHPLSTFRQTTGAVHLDGFCFLGNFSLPCWKVSEDFIFQTSSFISLMS